MGSGLAIRKQLGTVPSSSRVVNLNEFNDMCFANQHTEKSSLNKLFSATMLRHIGVLQMF